MAQSVAERGYICKKIRDDLSFSFREIVQTCDAMPLKEKPAPTLGEICTQLVEAAKRNGNTVTGLGEKLGIIRNDIYQWFDGRKTPSGEQLMKLCEFAKATPNAREDAAAAYVRAVVVRHPHFSELIAFMLEAFREEGPDIEHRAMVNAYRRMARAAGWPSV